MTNIIELKKCIEKTNLFIKDFSIHIDSKNDLQRGDKKAWGEWFDELELFSNLSDRVIENLNDHLNEVINE